MTALANAHGAVNLAQGFPDFDGPEHVKEAARRAIADGVGQYAPMPGHPALAAAVAERVRERTSCARDPGTEVVIGCGATELIADAILGLTQPGDRVVLVEPFYDAYLAACALGGVEASFVTLRPPRFVLDEEALRAAVREGTRVVLLNNPHNPSGRVFSRDELLVLARVAEEHDLVVIADEVYEDVVLEGEFVPFATLLGMAARTITLGSLSKSFSLTGWRIGWAHGPRDLVARVRSVHQFATFSAPSPLQVAAAAALASPPAYYAELRAAYARRREILVAALAGAGFEPFPSQGTYFVCAGFARHGLADDVACARWLTKEVGVAAIPPSAFTRTKDAASSYVRFTFSKREETLRAAAERLARLAPR